MEKASLRFSHRGEGEGSAERAVTSKNLLVRGLQGFSKVLSEIPTRGRSKRGRMQKKKCKWKESKEWKSEQNSAKASMQQSEKRAQKSTTSKILKPPALKRPGSENSQCQRVLKQTVLFGKIPNYDSRNLVGGVPRYWSWFSSATGWGIDLDCGFAILSAIEVA